MKQPSIQLRICPECDASNDAAASSCWLCHRPLGKGDGIVQAELVPEPRQSISETFFAVLTLATAVLTVLLIIGAAQSDQGIAAVVAICVTPALVATVIRTLGRRARGKPFSWQSTFMTFFLSVTAVIGLICVLIVALVIALFVMCLRMLNAM